jgi:hypothetical protein
VDSRNYEKICTLQMDQGTCNTPSDFGASGNGQPQQPPPPSNVAEVMAAQTELLRQLVQGQQAFQQFQQQHGGHNAHQSQAAGYLDFLATQPPLFHKTEEPLDADAFDSHNRVQVFSTCGAMFRCK